MIDVRIKNAFRKGNRDVVVDELHKMEKKRFELLFHLMDHYEWDLVVAVFMATDRAQHYFWKFMDPEHPNYDEADARKYGGGDFGCVQARGSIVGPSSEKGRR